MQFQNKIPYYTKHVRFIEMEEIVSLWAVGFLIHETPKAVFVNPPSKSTLYNIVKFKKHGAYEKRIYHEFPYLFL